MSKVQTEAWPEYRFLPRNWWVLLLQAAQMAHDYRKLLIALGGLLLLMGLGHRLNPPETATDPSSQPLVPGLPDLLADPVAAWKVSVQHTNDLWLLPIQAVQALIKPHDGWLPWTYALLRALGTGVVLVLMGAAIGRIAAHDVAGRPRPRLAEALKFSTRHARTLFLTILSPTLGIGTLALLCAFFGLFFRLPAPYGVWIGGALAVFPLLLAIPMALLVLGLMIGWPLMVMTVAAESEDRYEALSRAYSYTYRRLGRYLVLVAAAWLIGSVGWLVAVSVARLVLSLGVWGMSLGGPGTVVRELFAGSTTTAEAAPPLAGMLPGFWQRALKLLAYSWIFSYFWCAVAAIYMILRRDVDGASYSLVDGRIEEHPRTPPKLTQVEAVPSAGQAAQTVASQDSPPSGLLR